MPARGRSVRTAAPWPPPAAAALVALVTLAALFAAAHAHDWIGANGTPDCACLPHFKLDCASTAHVEKAWRALVSRECNATVATAPGVDGDDARPKVSLLADAAAAGAGAHAGHAKAAAKVAEEEEEEEPAPSRVYRCQVDQGCYEAYHVVVGHHYGCPPSFLPRAIAAGIHAYQTPASPVEADGATATPDTICAGCFQPRYVPGVAVAGVKDSAAAAPRLPTCPKLSCHANEAALLAAADAAAKAGCARDCSPAECKEAYQLLRVHHDGCVLNDNPMRSRVAADALRDACGAKHECAFSNGTYAAGQYKVDCAREKNQGPFRAPLEDVLEAAEAGGKVPVDHSAHDHGAASSAPANVPPAAAAAANSGAVMASTAVGAMVVAAAAAAALV